MRGLNGNWYTIFLIFFADFVSKNFTWNLPRIMSNYYILNFLLKLVRIAKIHICISCENPIYLKSVFRRAYLYLPLITHQKVWFQQWPIQHIETENYWIFPRSKRTHWKQCPKVLGRQSWPAASIKWGRLKKMSGYHQHRIR